MEGKGESVNVESIYEWIDTLQLSRQKRNINRDFSDAGLCVNTNSLFMRHALFSKIVPLAEILKQYYPKLVELHNYTPRNSMLHKMVNWETLNRKVLCKLNMTLSHSEMQLLAQSVPGSIEKVLRNIKSKIDSSLKEVPEKEKDDGRFFVEGLSSKISGTIIPVKQDNGKKTTDHKVVPLDLYEEMVNDISEKTEVIEILKNKVQHLESLLTIKDERISDLTKQIEKSGEKSTSEKFLSSIFST